MVYPTKKLTLLGLMLALVLVLSIIERMLPPLPMLPPQFGRLGLSNVIIMYLLFFAGKKEAFTMAFLKALFNFMMRGPTAGILSLWGGLLSLMLILLLLWLFKSKPSYVSLSIAGAVGHNIGQLIVACIIMRSWILFAGYLPVLLISGAVFGTLTGVVLKIIMPAFNRLYSEINEKQS